MLTNQTPYLDQSDNPTNCCPRFNPVGWDGQELHFKDKRFLRAKTISVAHVPLNMGKVFTRVQAAMAAAQAVDPTHWLVLSREVSAFSAEHLFAVTGDVPGEEMISVSGDFLTRVFEGDYGQVRHWHGEMEALARARGREPKAVWFFYTTCPKCAKVYGKNPVVGVVELT
ncbi:MAG: hypothetical protein FD162_403 [Rhodobacteraceae bacterium]|uniref:hydrolase n=1 Tax=Cypionkella sp. TaxID=2811411 RepID=UPI00132B802C|nr:hydrolase [Cypionkella sp.]KAF0175836.1 MAG: hypothetical protein FD162_403 [Paracoccaceae bacterium]MDO8325592.1 hypothetical protein [Cypionkella sp.]